MSYGTLKQPCKECYLMQDRGIIVVGDNLCGGIPDSPAILSSGGGDIDALIDALQEMKSMFPEYAVKPHLTRSIRD